MSATLRFVLTMTTPKTFAKELGRRLARIRKEQGLTQTELAEALNLSQAVVAEYEAGRKNMPTWRLINVAEALGVPPDMLLAEQQDGSAKRGPTPKLQKQMERISGLPKEHQRSIMQVLDMALQKG